METFLNKIFDWDHPVDDGQRIFFRVLEIILLGQIIQNIWQWGFYIKQLTDVVLPLGLANYVDMRFFFGSDLPIFNAGLITILLLLGFFRKWKYSYLVAIILYQLQYAGRFSQGEISHGSNLGGIILLCMGVSFIFFKEERQSIKAALGLIFFFIGLGYVSAAFSKMIGTGLNWRYGEHLSLWIAERGTDKLSEQGFYSNNPLQAFLVEYPWTATITLSFGLLTEMLGFLLWFRKTRWFETTLLILMHLGVLITMRISFSQYVYLLLFIGYPWNLLFSRLALKYPKLATL